MPTTINGIGTQYYGRKNPRVYQGQCESCNRQVNLSDYETGYYFVVLYIPLIPLGKKQILSDCPICRHHRSVPLSEWEQIREESLETGMADLAENIDDPSKAIALLGQMTVFNQMDEALELAEATAKQHADNFDTQIDLGAWYEQLGHKEKSDARYDRAVELNPVHPVSLRIRGVDAIQAGQLGEAAKHLEPLRDSETYYDPSLFFMLATAYQSKQMHAEALEEFRHLLERVPAFATDGNFRKAVKRTEKSLGQNTSILPKKGLFG